MNARMPIPMLPVLQLKGATAAPDGRGRRAEDGWPDAGTIRSLPGELAAVDFPSGRSAMGAALARLGVGAGARVLVPAYHCPSMITPLAWHGAVPVYYRLDDRFRPDLRHIEAELALGAQVVVAAHLFGRPLDLAPLRALCDRHGAALLEDCAHTLFYTADGPQPARLGDFAITSVRKFYPVRDGGQLLSARRAVAASDLRATRAREELKIAWNTLEDAVLHGEFPWLRPVVSGVERLRRDGVTRGNPAPGAPAAARDTSGTGAAGPGAEPTDARFDAASSARAMSRVSRWIVAGTAADSLVRQRRDNYRFLARALAGSDAGHVVDPGAEGVAVPYVLLFELTTPARYDELVRERFPVWRWDQLLVSGICPQSDRWRHRLIQLPVHQGLSRPQLLRLAQRLGGRAP
jgi:dTDP-4-amino-4,6-dideoxygalactose transaminase